MLHVSVGPPGAPLEDRYTIQVIEGNDFMAYFFGPYGAIPPAKPRDDKQCPTCKQPATASRWKGSFKQWICSNAHNWTEAESAKREEAAKAEQK